MGLRTAVIRRWLRPLSCLKKRIRMKKLFLDVAIEAAKASGRIQKKYLCKNHHIVYKGEPTNLVTDVDHRCEKRIISLIREHFPGHGFLAEEGGESHTASGYRWIIDPLDGTTNYAHRYPFFATSIALESDGEIILGVVFDPIRDELFTARKGKGAYLNGRKIFPSKTAGLEGSFLSTGFPYDVKKTGQNIQPFNQFVLQAQAVRRDGSASLDLCYTAMGRFDGFWEFSLAPWDMAAESLILKEAGAKVTLTSGKAFSIYKGDVLASNGRIHSDMARVLKRSQSYQRVNFHSP